MTRGICTLSIAAAFLASPALAAPVVTACSTGDITASGGAIVGGCTGGFTGNLNKGGVGTIVTAQSDLTTFNALTSLGLTGLFQVIANDDFNGSTINLGQYTGTLFIGVHHGAGGGAGNATSFYKITTGASGLSAFTYNVGGLSNASLYGVRALAVTPVPEPATWGLVILGFGALGYSMRRRATISTRIRFA